MTQKLLLALFFLIVMCGFSFSAMAQSGGSAFSDAVTANSGEDTIKVTSSENITIDEVYYKDAQGQWIPIASSEYAITPGDPSKSKNINFINGLLANVEYRVKYSWTSSKTPTVSLGTA